jgi:hypothetical protein
LIEQIDKDMSLAMVPAGRPLEARSKIIVAGFDTGQGNEKKHRSGTRLNNQRPLKGEKSDAGLLFQPCRDQ